MLFRVSSYEKIFHLCEHNEIWNRVTKKIYQTNNTLSQASFLLVLLGHTINNLLLALGTSWTGGPDGNGYSVSRKHIGTTGVFLHPI